MSCSRFYGSCWLLSVLYRWQQAPTLISNLLKLRMGKKKPEYYFFMNFPFTMLLGVKGGKCKPMTLQNDVTQTLDRNKSVLYKPPQDTPQFVMLQDFWNMRKNEFLTQSITLGSFVRWWSREENELDLQCGLTW